MFSEMQKFFSQVLKNIKVILCSFINQKIIYDFLFDFSWFLHDLRAHFALTIDIALLHAIFSTVDESRELNYLAYFLFLAASLLCKVSLH
jgi:hypothetical protein